jgi:hypothetical protein
MKKKITSVLLLAFLCYGKASAQSLLWAGKFGGDGEDVVFKMHVDGTGNIYTTGYFSLNCDFDIGEGVSLLQSGIEFDGFVQKTDTDGNFLWARQFGGAIGDNGDDVTIDDKQNVIATGVFQGSADFDPGEEEFMLNSSGEQDIFVVKLDVNGNFLWAKSIGGLNYEESQAIGTDSSGNVYISGYFYNTIDCDPGEAVFNLTTAGIGDGFLVKLDADGNFVWARQFGGTGFELATDMKVKKTGDVYLVGNFEGTADFDPDTEAEFTLTAGANLNAGFLVHVNADGEFVSAAKTAETTSFMTSLGVDLDTDNAAYITGFFAGTGSFDLADGSTETFIAPAIGLGYVVKVLENGDLAWAKAIDSDLGSLGYNIAVNASNTIVTTGYYDGSLSLGDISLTKSTSNAMETYIAEMDVDGNFISAFTFGGANLVDKCAIAIDDLDNVYLAGAFENTVDINPISGTQLLASSFGFRDNYLIKMTLGALGVPDATKNLVSIYPNPTSGQIHLEGPDSLTGSDFNLFEITGKKIMSGIVAASREINLSHLASGAYFMQIGTNTYKILKR